VKESLNSRTQVCIMGGVLLSVYHSNMDEKLQIIQMLIDAENPSTLARVKALLTQKADEQIDTQNEIPDEIREETKKMREDRLS